MKAMTILDNLGLFVGIAFLAVALAARAVSFRHARRQWLWLGRRAL